MAIQTSRRLPGIRFEVQPPPLTDVLPRMDVAVFVGFATSGPLHTPVAIEDVAHFTAIFGDDLPLAWNAQSGETVYAYLASSVRAFFRNGGRRCWIIRVGKARYNTFSVPHMTQPRRNQQTGTWDFQLPPVIQASSAGSWSDALRVNTTLLSDLTAIDALTFSSDQQSIILALTSEFDILEGSLLQAIYLDGAKAKYVLYALLENVQVTRAKSVESSSQHFSATAGTFFLFQAAAPKSPEPPNPPLLDEPPVQVDPIPAQADLDKLTKQGAILTFELWARYGDGSLTHISDLGFSPRHPRFWGALPTNEQGYIDTGVPTDNPYAALWQEALQHYFPLSKGSTEDVPSIPVNMSSTLMESEFTGANPTPVPLPDSRPETPLDRDGLAAFDVSLFVDRELQVDVTTENLLAQADYISYQRPERRPLEGIHAALYIDEATIIAAPDAVYLGWTSSPDGKKIPDPPEPAPPTLPVQTSTSTFHNCAVPSVTSAPVLTQPLPKVQTDTFTLTWTPVGTDSQKGRYTLQEATRPDLADAVSIYTGPDTALTLSRNNPHVYYYRVNAQLEGSSVSDWSNAVVVRIAPLHQLDHYDPEQLLLLHTALLRLCGARSDIFAVMALPAHYREDDAIRHVELLKSGSTSLRGGREIDANVLGYDEARAFSFGALYHPWLIGRENSQLDELRQTPPDGAAAGIMARRASTRGAWIAPANEVLSNVVALTPPLARARWLDLQEAQLNIIRQEPRGFLYLSADTLSDDSELRPIHVRRLLILLRRAALRLGVEYVFEPNNDAFRRAVQRGFEAMLEQLFVRGAFAGNVASEGFQVVTKSYLNTPQSVEQGRFIVEIKVAPSQPLTFLTVRLLQSNAGSLVTEG